MSAGRRSPTGPTAPDPAPAPSGFRWGILALLATSQLMVVLDGTIFHVAMPSAQLDLGFATAQRAWIVTAYALAFGSLLLLGGRLGDRFGRRRTFIVGLLGFAVVSAIGGQARSVEMLVAARALQGVFAALLAPASLGILSLTFVVPRERSRAFAIFGTVSGVGSMVGLLLGGVLTELISWRWCLYINVAVAVPVAVGAFALLPRSLGTSAHRPRIDLPGAATASLGLLLVVLGLALAEAEGWADRATIASLVGGGALLGVFVAIQRRVAQPLLPLGIVADRNRGGALLALALNAVAMLSSFLFLTYYFQRNLGFGPIQAGLAFLPMTLSAMTTGVIAGTRLLPRFGPRRVIPVGMLTSGAAMAYLAQLDDGSAYLTGVLPALVVLGVGGFRVASGAISIAQLVTFVMFLFFLVGPVGTFFGAVTSVNQALGALGRIQEVLDLPTETDGDERVAEMARLLSGLPDSESGLAHARELLELRTSAG
ncbi:MAG: MFS transporter [Patulibacter sp.]|nr:MFS transporter [Patulibacter sp.]